MSDDQIKCSFPDGVCQAHGAIEERRRHEGELIKIIPRILTVQNRMIGAIGVVSFFTIIILSGIFYYLQEIKTSYKEADILIKSDQSAMLQAIQLNSSNIATIATLAGKNEARSQILLGELRDFTEAIRDATIESRERRSENKVGSKKDRNSSP